MAKFSRHQRIKKYIALLMSYVIRAVHNGESGDKKFFIHKKEQMKFLDVPFIRWKRELFNSQYNVKKDHYLSFYGVHRLEIQVLNKRIYIYIECCE